MQSTTVIPPEDEEFSGVTGSGFNPNDATSAFSTPASVITTDIMYQIAPAYTASKMILAVVGSVALVVLIVFAILTLRYRFGKKGSYYVDEFRMETNEKSTQGGETLFSQSQTQEFMF